MTWNAMSHLLYPLPNRTKSFSCSYSLLHQYVSYRLTCYWVKLQHTLILINIKLGYLLIIFHFYLLLVKNVHTPTTCAAFKLRNSWMDCFPLIYAIYTQNGNHTTCSIQGSSLCNHSFNPPPEWKHTIRSFLSVSSYKLSYL